MEDKDQPDTSDRPSGSSSSDSMMKCRFCGRNLEKFFSLELVYCPFCGAAVNASMVPGPPKKDSNILTGRALWPLKWSLLGVLIGMGILFGSMFGVEFLVVLIILFSNPSFYLANQNALLNDVNYVLLNPLSMALLSLLELFFLIFPLILLRKYRRPLNERFMLLGWKPYFGNKAPSPGGWPRFLKDIGVSAIIAMALVGFQFIVNIANYALWAPLIPNAPDISGADVSTTAQDVFQFIILVGSMLFIVAPTEEFLFRGFSQQGLESRIGEKRAWIISAVIFAFAHVFELLFTLNTLLLFPFLFFPYLYLSMVMCGIFWKTKNLNLMIYIHGMYDSFLVLYSSIIPLSPGNSSDLFVYISMLVCIALASMLLVKWLMARKARMAMLLVKTQETR